MNTLAPSFLTGSSSYLQVTRTSIISRTSLKFGQIGPRTAELAALVFVCAKSQFSHEGAHMKLLLATLTRKMFYSIGKGID